MSDSSAASTGVHERRDEQGTPPAVWLLAARIGALFGMLFGVYAGIARWVRSGIVREAFASWGYTAIGAGAAFALIYAAVLFFTARGGRAIESATRKVTVLVHLPHARAFAVATKALRAIDDVLHDADLVAGTAAVETAVRERLFGTLRLRFDAKVVDREKDRCDIVVSCTPIVGSIDFGASRGLLERVVRTIDDAVRSGRIGSDAVELEAVPKKARAMFEKNGFRVVGLRSLRKEAPAIAVQLMAAGDAPAQAVVLTLPHAVSEAVLRSAAEGARVSGAAQSRVGEGFAVIPLAAGEAAGRVAARVHQALLAGDPTYRGAVRAAKRDEKDPASTSRTKWPR